MKATQLRRGSVIVYNGAPHKVLEFHHNTPGKGQAVVQTKLRNLITGIQTEVRFKSTENIDEADIYSFPAQFLYEDDSGYHFMNSKSYEQLTISRKVLEDSAYYLCDGMEVEITTYEGAPIGVNLPPTVVLTVAETEPELKGATATSSYKPAKLNTGLSISVPPFIKEGDKIIVSTEEGKYVGRADTVPSEE